MDNQLSLWDCFPELTQESKYPQIINDLHSDIMNLFMGYQTDDCGYYVWEHVPYLGKRYRIWVYDVIPSDKFWEQIEELINKYAKKSLEISAIPVPDEGTIDIMISTLWKTKGHKEIR